MMGNASLDGGDGAGITILSFPFVPFVPFVPAPIHQKITQKTPNKLYIVYCSFGAKKLNVKRSYCLKLLSYNCKLDSSLNLAVKLSNSLELTKSLN